MLETRASGRAAAKKFGMPPSSVNRWYKEFSSLKKPEKAAAKNQISDEHKAYIKARIGDNNANLTIVDIHKDLCDQFMDLDITKSAISTCIKNDFSISLSLRPVSLPVHYDVAAERDEFLIGWSEPTMNYLQNCIFFGETTFDLFNSHIPYSSAATHPKAPQQTRRAMVALCSIGVANFRLQYCKFLCDSLDQLKQGYKGCYIIVNGLSLDKNVVVQQHAISNGFKYLRIPHIDCELDPCQQFWKEMVVKFSQKASDATTTTRFHNALSLIDPKYFVDIITNCENNYRQHFTKFNTM
ncbi:hypothetical protein BC940DRAFT_289571 [Gongronella butleri]|nr:hypothetical protein BC940DRAFT_289571 [Gongronella butleri]